MALNKSKGNMYPWISHTWNPLAGECPHRCSYCSTNKLMRYPGIKNKYSGSPRIDEKQMKTNLGKGNFIFVVAQSDLFAENIPDEMIQRVLDYCEKFENKYLFQTKNPRRVLDFKLPKSVICTTIETDIYYKDIMRNSPKPAERSKYMNMLSDCGFETFVTIEPIMDFDTIEMIRLVKACAPAQVNIGADSGNNNLPEPSKEKVQKLIKRLETFTTVKLKTNLKRITG